jgi:hypothetical protein
MAAIGLRLAGEGVLQGCSVFDPFKPMSISGQVELRQPPERERSLRATPRRYAPLRRVNQYIPSMP